MSVRQQQKDEATVKRNSSEFQQSQGIGRVDKGDERQRCEEKGKPRIRSGVLGLNKAPRLRSSLIGPTEAWASTAWTVVILATAELNLAVAGH
ncbi:unnamed protein product [Fusarium venenatum]|uniref:Uncharacterized protein n=1 Tax=Fusarium venenatum TaxID=56646 RepID=A0A2L2SQM7_9HYPO|nr:uncharacterized protein FVRRES_13095 [Fusarium venenatum]CEI40404.1 unnamed protein product [Fusarium venenatum]